MAIPANLDAFIIREDFFADNPNPGEEYTPKEIGILELQEDQLAPLLRKPDFQRTTAAWTPERIKDFIKSFVDGDLIPAVIFWSSKTGNIVVVDGAHRLSALLAWINDDYGDKKISKEFQGFQNDLDQEAAAKITRDLVNKRVGSFQDILNAKDKDDTTEEQKRISRLLRRRKIKVQWIDGDAEKAEESFYRINLSSVRLEKTELHLIRKRNHPESIATRAVVQHGDGHPYWEKFSPKQAEDTVKIAKEIHSLLFSPPLEIPIETTDLPMGGKAYAGVAMEVALNLIEFANKGEPHSGSLGEKTVRHLQRTWEMLTLLGGRKPGSLGLHPAVYFYNQRTGRHQPESLMAAARWFLQLENNGLLVDFSKCRKAFEDFLILNVNVIGDIITKKGTRMRSVPTVVHFYDVVLKELLDAADAPRIFRKLGLDPKLKPFINQPEPYVEYGAKISDTVRSSVFLKDALEGVACCKICGARFYRRNFNFDHAVDKKGGGLGDPANSNPSHFYCNSNKDKILVAIATHRQRTGELF